jgi:hypothetical protein
MGYILDGMSIATDGFASPVEFDDGDPEEYCLAPFALISHGIIVLLEEDEDDKLADPYVGPSRFNEPFDRGYYLWKYGPPKTVTDSVTVSEEPEPPPQIDEDELREGLRRRRIANYEAREIRRMEREVREGLELKLYIAELEDELEARLADLVKAAEEERQRRQALIARLEENRVAAREALFLVLERQRKRRNMQIAVESSIRLLY